MAGVPGRIGAYVRVCTLATCMAGKCYIHYAMPLRQLLASIYSKNRPNIIVKPQIVDRVSGNSSSTIQSQSLNSTSYRLTNFFIPFLEVLYEVTARRTARSEWVFKTSRFTLIRQHYQFLCLSCTLCFNPKRLCYGNL